MKNIVALTVLLFMFGLAKAQSNREDIEIRWPKTEHWKLDQEQSVQTDFSRRHYKWDVKEVNGVSEFYITANSKSNQLQQLLKGQSAKIMMDDFLEVSLLGTVSAIGKLKNGSPLSSPNNQSWNYVKMVEKSPVTIKAEVGGIDKGKFISRMNCRVRMATAP